MYIRNICTYICYKIEMPRPFIISIVSLWHQLKHTFGRTIGFYKAPANLTLARIHLLVFLSIKKQILQL